MPVWSPTTGRCLRPATDGCWCVPRQLWPEKWRFGGLGILQFPYEPVAVAGLVVTLDDPSAERIPERRIIEIKGILLPHLAVGPGVDPLPLVLAQAGILGCREH